MPAGACGTCGAADVTPLFRKNGHRYVVCGQCEGAWVYPMPAPAETRAVYDESYFRGGRNGGYLDYARDAELHRRNGRRRLALIRAAGVTGPGSLVDVGCALGFFLDEARAAGWDVHGVDISAWALEEAGRRFGLETSETLGSLARDRPGTVDIVTFFQSLEHVSNPAAALRAAYACLKPGGHLVIETWDRGSRIARFLGRHWQQVSPPSVLHLFTRRGLDELLARAGFHAHAMRSTRKLVSLGFVGNLLRQKYPRAGGLVHAATCQPGLRTRALRYGLGDLMTVVAHKTPAGGPAKDISFPAGT